jgi:hypothetical protein
MLLLVQYVSSSLVVIVWILEDASPLSFIFYLFIFFLEYSLKHWLLGAPLCVAEILSGSG